MDYLLKTTWWKWVCIVCLIYTMVGGLLFPVPDLPILNETIRVLYFHVPCWFGMVLLLMGSVVYAIRYLAYGRSQYDIYASNLAYIGVFYGILGLITGMVWANFTWGEPWSNDPKQNASAVALLIYFAYFILRGAFQDAEQRAKVSAVYNILAFAVMIPLLFILPRLTPDSLHPGNGGNPGFNAYDLDNDLRKVFYVAVVGWTLLGYWMACLFIRIKLISKILEDV